MTKKKSLKQLLTRRFLTITTIPMLFVMVFFALSLVTSIQEDISSDQQLVATFVENRINILFDQISDTLIVVSKGIETQNMTKEEVAESLDFIMKQYPILENIQIVDPTGIIRYTPTKKMDWIGFDMTEQDFYQTYMADENRGVETFMSLGYPSDQLVVIIRDLSDRLIVGYCSKNELQGIVENIRQRPSDQVAIVERGGYFLAHSDLAHPSEMEPFFELLTNEKIQFLTYHGKMNMVQAFPLANTDFRVIYYKDFYDTYEAVFRILLLVVLSLMGYVTILLVFYHRYTNPVIKGFQSLIHKTGDIREGNYNVQLESSQIEEMDDLFSNFNVMALTIQRMFSQLSDKQAQLEILNDDLSGQNSIIKENERQISYILDNTYDGIIYINAQYEVIWINKAAFKLFDILPSSFYKGIKCHQLLAEREMNCDMCEVGFIKKTKKAFTKILTIGDGVVEATYFPLFDEDDEFIGVIKSYRDVTENKNLEKKLNQAIKMEAIGRLTGGIAHDFNNVLQVIIGYSDLVKNQLERQNSAPNIIKRMEMISDAANRAERLIKKLMTFSRTDQTTFLEVDINKIVKELYDMVSRIIGEDIHFTLNLQEDLPTIFADSTQIELVIMNLCVNSKHAMPGGGKIEIRTSLTQKNDMSYVVLEVEDTGSGIPDSIKDKIFDPFFTTKELGQGTGLGLASVLGIVMNHQGFIELDTTVGEGTTFRILLPLRLGERLKSEDTEQTKRSKLSDKTILLIEDDDAARSIAAKVIGKTEARIIEAIDGSDAIRKFGKYQEQIDLAIIDVIMPLMDGIQVYEQIKEMRSDIKVIFTTGYTNDLIENRLHTKKSIKVVQKPYKSEDLLETIYSVFEDKNA